jgi:signal transduction histidine kinase
VNIDCPSDLLIDSYPSALFQTITILVINSLTHAFSPGEEGVINIRVTTSADNIVLKYADSGKGIAPEIINKIFEPFYTTRRGQGSIGLGLNIAYNRVVQLLKGTMSCESVLGKGSIFTIIFAKKL